MAERFVNLTSRERSILGLALWQLAQEAHARCDAAAQDKRAPDASKVEAFARDAEDAEALRHEIAKAHVGIPSDSSEGKSDD